MTHGLEADDTMAYAEENGPPWHGLGVPVQGAQSGKDMLEKAGLDWLVDLRPTYVYAGGDHVKLPDHFAVVRKDTAKVLSVVKYRYCPLQNHEVFDFADGLIANGNLLYETAGSLLGSRRIWALARIPEREISIGNNDVIYPYLLFSSSHDGSSLFRVLPTFIRVVCKNTHDAAVFTTNEEIKQLTIEIRHTGDVNSKISQAREVLKLSHVLTDRMQRISEELLAVDGLPLLDGFLNTLFPIREDAGKRTKQNRETSVGSFRGILDQEVARRGEMTAMDLFNATTGFVDHVKTIGSRDSRIRTREDSRMESAMFLSGSHTKSQALQVLLDMTGIFEKLDEQKVLIRR